MFALALLIGAYSYGIFALGLLGLLYKSHIAVFTVLFLSLIVIWKRKPLISCIKKFLLQSRHIRENIRHALQELKKHKVFGLLILLFLLQASVNLIGVFGPELSFDALWYHLTLPKLYLLHHAVYHIPGGLLYYSDMPKLTEMLYVPALAFGSETLVKFVHFTFGILTCIAIYKLSRTWFTPFLSLLAVLIFYSNLVVGWESFAAYIDLARTFFEVMALWAFLNWWESAKQKWLLISAVLIGLAITTKLLAIGSLLIFTLLLVGRGLQRKNIEDIRKTISTLFTYWFVALLIPLPWLIFSSIHTGNPVYPFFSAIYQVSPSAINPISFFRDIFILFTHASDPVSLMYIITFPFVIFYFTKLKREIKVIALYSLFAIIAWYFTPRTGGGRFIMPYLPAMSIVIIGVLDYVRSVRKKKLLSNILIVLIILSSMFSIVYRFAANYKYVPVIIGKESKESFLTKHLNFSFSDFYDTDNYFKNTLQANDRVLLYGFHNLYYVDFPFIDSSWVTQSDRFNYVATQNVTLPEKYRKWKLVYKNDQTMVKLYKRPVK